MMSQKSAAIEWICVVRCNLVFRSLFCERVRPELQALRLCRLGTNAHSVFFVISYICDNESMAIHAYLILLFLERHRRGGGRGLGCKYTVNNCSFA